jgi:8-oxo-dGTP pyrophosphatase MutT (NUDIX family)
VASPHQSAELWQEYNEHGKAQCALGALHGAAHVWIWRRRNGEIEILLQRRAPGKPTWGGLLDISAAGHIDLGETPLTAALRETEEEIGLKLRPQQLHFIGVHRAHLVAESGIIENEFQWLWLAPLPKVAPKLSDGEVHSVQWRPLRAIRREVTATETAEYVPHGAEYYALILAAIEHAAAT